MSMGQRIRDGFRWWKLVLAVGVVWVGWYLERKTLWDHAVLAEIVLWIIAAIVILTVDSQPRSAATPTVTR